jgi:hypothetical protein
METNLIDKKKLKDNEIKKKNQFHNFFLIKQIGIKNRD